jgi:uncharacterized protein YdeI (YjbR/CyaY-like superfamily)
MDIGETLYVTDRAAWRNWLAANYQTADEIWLVLYRKASDMPSLPYNDAVEEALCFGWIDSIIKSIDDDRRAQRYSRRRPGSGFSPMNKERLRRLIATDQVAEDVLPLVSYIPDEVVEWPEDIMAELQANPAAWDHFQTFSEPYQRIRVGWVDGARSRPDEFRKRLDYFLKMTAQGKQYGYGIESYY